jgi:hypothetical protein
MQRIRQIAPTTLLHTIVERTPTPQVLESLLAVFAYAQSVVNPPWGITAVSQVEWTAFKEEVRAMLLDE